MADIQQVEQIKLVGLESRLGKKTIEWHNLGMRYGDRILFSNFEYNLQRNDRIGVLGNNGSGKSTLLNILSKTIEPTQGEVIWGETVKIGYFKQGNDDLDDSKVVIDYIREISDDLETAEGHFSAKQMLERFLFDSNLQYSKIGYLSGGERRRLYLLTILMKAPNILLFDEPTNDLDIQTLSILEDYLDDFNGAVIVVSHDRYFLDRVCDFLFVFEDQTVQRYVGGYSSYFESRQPKEKKKGDGAIQYSMQKKLQRATQPYLSSKDKKELETMESVIADLEEQVKAIDLEMNDCSDFEKINELSKQREELCELIEQKNERWMELMEIEEQIKQMRK